MGISHLGPIASRPGIRPARLPVRRVQDLGTDQHRPVVLPGRDGVVHPDEVDVRVPRGVDRLQAQHLRPALHGYAAPDGIDPRIGDGEPRFHRQRDHDNVAGLEVRVSRTTHAARRVGAPLA